jgi:hypothetical protein
MGDEMKWQPTAILTATLEGCGVDLDILESISSSSLDFLTAKNELAIIRQFTYAVISQQVSWCNTESHQLVDEPSIFIEPKSHIQIGWRPKEETISLLTDILKLTDRIDIGFVREWFIRANEGTYARSWDCLFIKYAFSCHNEQEKITESSTAEKSTKAVDDYPEELRLKNLATIRAIVAELLKSIDIAPYFNKPLDESWQPEKWVVNKLQKRFDLSKRFIFDEKILRPFISHQASSGKIFDDYNTLYFHWVLKRFRAFHKYYLDEKKRLEKLANSDPQII